MFFGNYKNITKKSGWILIVLPAVALLLCAAVLYRNYRFSGWGSENSGLPNSQIQNQGKGKFIWGLRSAVSGDILNSDIIEASELIKVSPLLVAQALSGELDKEFARHQPVPLLNQDGATSPGVMAFLPASHGESLDISGRPLRWQLPENIISAYSLPKPFLFAPPQKDSPGASFGNLLNKLQPSVSAASYRALVETYARKYKLNSSLIMAIVHSESNFQPALISRRSAMGLMQVLPSTANGEIHRFLYGSNGQMTFSDLAIPEINIRFGTTYLHILFSRYFSGVKDPQVRETCVIASYNLGPNRFLKLYGPTNELAIAAINSMQPDEFHTDLPNRLPVQETRYYVEKVKRMKKHYGAPRQ